MSFRTGAIDELQELNDTRDALRDRLLAAARALILVEDRRAGLLLRLVDRDPASSHDRRRQARQAQDDADALTALLAASSA